PVPGVTARCKASVSTGPVSGGPTRMSHDMRYKPGCLFTGSSRTVVPAASTIDSDSLLSAETELSKYETRGPGSGFCPVKPREPIPDTRLEFGWNNSAS